MRRNDLWILLAVLGAALLAFWLGGRALSPAATDGAAYLRVTIDGETRELIPLTEARELVLEQPGGERNVVAIYPGGFRMAESNCRNQDCVHQGDVNADTMAARVLYNQIVCLPNRVVLELVTDPETEYLTVDTEAAP